MAESGAAPPQTIVRPQTDGAAFDELLTLALNTFENAAAALSWLEQPHPALKVLSPKDACGSPQGAQRVREILIGLRFGGVA